ncbi:glycine cleavage system protein GcvH [Vallitalea guaymasensis]|uniref:Glycine cleavage system H protein n=1 Tax=Vallitalea guaymasensis TaxID=1185412 RepID=A0A8J8ME87_9FIRM|nr:glycine cleavage system protein GcvH [Vallitalea guaymasensis]QUH31287.1 glycine cleavage system protein GcvH [Vallitalea guaymasensis]
MKIMEGYYYTKNHEWVKVDGNTAIVGVSDYAQHAMGQIVYVELPEIDDEFSKEDAFSVVESVKAASDIYMPVGGTIVEVNEDLDDEPELINTDPYTNYICKIELTDENDIEGLMNAKEYEEFCDK